MSASEAPANRLAHSTSPYLRQHAHNFVDWVEWGPEALARARAEDKPILLSVGYSACHWCHVMAHECFDDPAIAARMNEHFVNIKVDREERPDIDAIYQKVVALMGQGGGWPLTVFLTPDQRPFYGGTYFPPADRYGRPGFPRVLDALATLWAERREEALEQAEAFMGGLADIASSVDEDASGELELPLSSPASLAEASRRLLAQIDPEWGGFGRAPKFPNVPSLALMLRAVQAEQAGHGAAEALASTLEKMWRGGIYDHLRGGFARYSVDREWLIPHFEKMLYDNALLLGLYADASVVLGATRERAFLRRVVEETAAYLLADMRDDRGVFYSATDADSEGVEGKYFCWTPAQLDEVLGPALGRTFARAFGVTEAGNFEHGMSVLHRPQPLTPSLEAELEPARAKLLEHRYGRVPPLRDDKVITAWNALVISGFCKAASAAERWGEPERVAAWIEVAQTTCAELLRTHRDADARLLRASWQGRAHTRAFLEDVGLLARACLDVHELTLEPRWQAEAEALARECLEHYARAGAEGGDRGAEGDDDPRGGTKTSGGGFYEAADDGEALIERTESRHDSPLPSGLAAAVEVLARLDLGGASLTSEALTGRAAVEQTLRRFHRASARPFAYAGLIAAAQWASDRAAHVSVRAASPEAGQALASIVRRAKPTIPTPVALTHELAPGLARPEALVCRAQSCSLPLGDPEALLAALSEVPHDPPR